MYTSLLGICYIPRQPQEFGFSLGESSRGWTIVSGSILTYHPILWGEFALLNVRYSPFLKKAKYFKKIQKSPLWTSAIVPFRRNLTL